MKTKTNYHRSNLKQAKLLVIDDNDDQWLLMQQLVISSMSEVTVVRAATPAEALSLLTEWCHQEWEMPQLILLDLYLPTRDQGWELLNQIKTMDALVQRIPVILFSSSTDLADITQAYDLGISAYMAKPIEISDWQTYFKMLRSYWLDTVTLPPIHYGS